jgi:hypothetical protein
MKATLVTESRPGRPDRSRPKWLARGSVWFLLNDFGLRRAHRLVGREALHNLTEQISACYLVAREVTPAERRRCPPGRTARSARRRSNPWALGTGCRSGLPQRPNSPIREPPDGRGWRQTQLVVSWVCQYTLAERATCAAQPSACRPQVRTDHCPDTAHCTVRIAQR